MKAITLSATFDGEHIRLEEHFPWRKDARLLVTVLPDSENDDALREFWRQLSAQSISRAYGANEPDYTMDMVREPNPKYEGR